MGGLLIRRSVVRSLTSRLLVEGSLGKIGNLKLLLMAVPLVY